MEFYGIFTMSVQHTLHTVSCTLYNDIAGLLLMSQHLQEVAETLGQHTGVV